MSRHLVGAVVAGRRRAWSVMGALVLLLIVGRVSRADFKPVGVQEDGANFFSTNYNWTFGTNPTSRTDGANWVMALDDTDDPFTGRSLQLNIRHQVPTLGPNFVFNYLNIVQPLLGTSIFVKAQQQSHGLDDVDIVRTVLAVRPQGVKPEAQVSATGMHVAAGTPFTASITANRLPLTGVQITPSYRQADNTLFFGPPINLPDPPANTKVITPLPASATNPATTQMGRLSDYKITAFGSGQTETTMAFVGDVNGVTSELDLDAGSLLFSNYDDFLMPMLSRSDDGGNLYVAIDLTQWLGQGGTFTAGQTFTDVSNGTSPELPGVMIANDPIDFTPGVGFTVQSGGTLFSGDVFARAVFDGQAVPEPATSMLLGLALPLGLLRRNRRGM